MTMENKAKTTPRKDNKNSDVTIVGSEQPISAKPAALPKRNQPVLTFDAWWMLAQNTYKLALHLKEPVYKHFKARGFLESKKFDEGLRDFGC